MASSLVLVKKPSRRTNILFANRPEDIKALAEWSRTERCSIMFKTAEKKYLVIVSTVNTDNNTITAKIQAQLEEGTPIETYANNTAPTNIFNVPDIISAVPLTVPN